MVVVHGGGGDGRRVGHRLCRFRWLTRLLVITTASHVDGLHEPAMHFQRQAQFGEPHGFTTATATSAPPGVYSRGRRPPPPNCCDVVFVS
jgi:hypothetical protein